MDYVVVVGLVQGVGTVRDGCHRWYVDGFTILVQLSASSHFMCPIRSALRMFWRVSYTGAFKSPSTICRTCGDETMQPNS